MNESSFKNHSLTKKIIFALNPFVLKVILLSIGIVFIIITKLITLAELKGTMTIAKGGPLWLTAMVVALSCLFLATFGVPRFSMWRKKKLEQELTLIRRDLEQAREIQRHAELMLRMFGYGRNIAGHVGVCASEISHYPSDSKEIYVCKEYMEKGLAVEVRGTKKLVSIQIACTQEKLGEAEIIHSLLAPVCIDIMEKFKLKWELCVNEVKK